MLGALIIRLLVNTAALLVGAMVVKTFDPEAIIITNWQSAVVAGAVFGVVNSLIKPLVACLTCLVQVITLGLFTFVINALMLLLAARAFELVAPLVPEWQLRFEVHGFGPAFFCALVMSITSTILTRAVR